MVRQKSRKGVEELCAAVPPPPPLATTRFDENFFQNSKNVKCNKMTDCNNNTATCRKKSKGPNVAIDKKDEKTFFNEERLLGKVGKSKKSSSSLDNKNLKSFLEDSEKDEDTEEFFELIKETVENAVGKTLSDLLSRNFREVSAKIDDVRQQLQAYEIKLEKIHNEIDNKIVHYGEENSRHFRYLCMKSEYDKMFYQHQNIMTAMPVDARPNVINPYPQQFAPSGQSAPQQSQMPSASYSSQPTKSSTLPKCNCHNTGCGDFGNVERSKCSMSTKSSEIGMKDLLEQLQKLYDQQQSHVKDGGKNVHDDVSLNIQDDTVDEDDDSSDNLSSPGIEGKLGAGGDC